MCIVFKINLFDHVSNLMSTNLYVPIIKNIFKWFLIYFW